VLKLVVGLLSLCFRAALFGPAHELLPAKVRPTSFGFISLAVLYIVASQVRHVAVGGADVLQVLALHLSFVSLLFVLFASRHLSELALYFAASVGVDLCVAALGVSGLDITSDDVHRASFAWEMAATLVAIVRMRSDRRQHANWSSSDRRN